MLFKRVLPLVAVVVAVTLGLLAFFADSTGTSAPTTVTTSTTATPLVPAVASSPVLAAPKSSGVAALPVPTGANLATAAGSTFESYEIQGVVYEEVRDWYASMLPAGAKVGEWELCRVDDTQTGTGEERIFTSPQGVVRLTLTSVDESVFVVLLMNGNNTPTC